MFVDFAAERGLTIQHLERGRWVRVPTVDHPRKRNGAYFFDGDYAHVQNWATMDKAETWMARKDSKPDRDMERRMAESRAQNERERREGHARATTVGAQMISEASRAEHDYLRAKGFGSTIGLVTAEGVLLIPMRDVSTGALLGVQRIRKLEDGSFEKKMLPGMRARGAVYRLGDHRSAETWLVEGFATGLSVDAALTSLRLSASVLVCFSAGNLVHVSSMVGGRRFVFADNDASGAGQDAALKTGFAWTMADTVGQDANDLHLASGIFAVRAKIVACRSALTCGV